MGNIPAVSVCRTDFRSEICLFFSKNEHVFIYNPLNDTEILKLSVKETRVNICIEL